MHIDNTPCNALFMIRPRNFWCCLDRQLVLDTSINLDINTILAAL